MQSTFAPTRRKTTAFVESRSREWDIDLTKSIMVGDKLADIQLALRLGMKPVLVRTGYGRETECAGIPPDVMVIDSIADLDLA